MSNENSVDSAKNVSPPRVELAKREHSESQVQRQQVPPDVQNIQWMAKAIAAAGEAIPKSYRNNPGSIVLLLQWAEARGIDIATAISCVTFIDGKPVVEATLQRALAKRHGILVKPTKISDESATVVVVDEASGEIMGEATFTLDDAKRMGLANNPRRPNWQTMPKNMLVARATTNAIRWYAPEVLAGVLLRDEYEDMKAMEAAIQRGELK